MHSRGVHGGVRQGAVHGGAATDCNNALPITVIMRYFKHALLLLLLLLLSLLFSHLEQAHRIQGDNILLIYFASLL